MAKETIQFESKRMARDFRHVMILAGRIRPDRVKIEKNASDWTSVTYPVTKTTRIVFCAFMFGKRGWGM